MPILRGSLLALILSIAFGDSGGTLDEANRLRDAATEDWKAERFKDAAEKLGEADAILAALDGDHAGDRAVVLRARIHSLVSAKDAATARASFTTLSAIVRGHADLESEVADAYGVLYGAARDAKTPADAEATLAGCEHDLKAAGLDRLAAQTIHDRGSLAAARGDVKTMERWYAAAIDARQRVKDFEGLAWTWNDLGYERLKAGRLEDALEPLGSAERLVDDGKAVGAQSALAINFTAIETALAGNDPPAARTCTWLWQMAESAAKSKEPERFAADHWLRMALAADLKRGGAKGALVAARHVAGVELKDHPREVKSDLLLRAADAALMAGPTAASTVEAWLAAAEPGTGPCAPHLAARRLVLQARAAAMSGDSARFDALAPQAVAAWRALGDFAGIRVALDALVKAGATLKHSDALASLRTQADDAHLAGAPGGAGGSAVSQSGGKNNAALSPHDPLFRVAWTNGTVLLTDLADGSGLKLGDGKNWAPSVSSFNGCSVQVFGGYVQIRDVSSGDSTSASGAEGSTTLDKLGSYLPVPEKGAIVIVKNGAWRYELEG